MKNFTTIGVSKPTADKLYYKKLELIEKKVIPKTAGYNAVIEHLLSKERGK